MPSRPRAWGGQGRHMPFMCPVPPQQLPCSRPSAAVCDVRIQAVELLPGVLPGLPRSPIAYIRQHLPNGHPEAWYSLQLPQGQRKWWSLGMFQTHLTPAHRPCLCIDFTRRQHRASCCKVGSISSCLQKLPVQPVKQSGTPPSSLPLPAPPSRFFYKTEPLSSVDRGLWVGSRGR